MFIKGHPAYAISKFFSHTGREENIIDQLEVEEKRKLSKMSDAMDSQVKKVARMLGQHSAKRNVG